MEYVYAALLLNKAGQPITEENVTKVLQAAGVQVNEARVKALVAALQGVNINEIISQAAPVATPTQAAPTPKKEEPKKVSETEAAAGLSSLFG
ncbi:MAG: 50S ribosomal protein P1 [Candidatus Parvarchaeota archaeon]|nr:50S ribosomal protein P1 [Candidatus Jingweiarchaeum tengchongense]MCW1297762.1 50S ribosomal protein P1 [Candidatus Jingweiarchaeum tengchongense]MCW1299772.1 50S ribosomal protein P1 [Candidatus Jingweiarchaeum tengchongense]MCW1304257.1 50S ribosomal protein P1 [Candidatus Jingweiarchaeum tengchongense]MCW1305285.1 50S ribosomal protein P1 [Candidatus Jingweiarchaeum tengchongense]